MIGPKAYKRPEVDRFVEESPSNPGQGVSPQHTDSEHAYELLKEALDCAKCRDLDRAFRFKVAKYVEACSSPFDEVSIELTTRNRIDMQGAKDEMEEHLLKCLDATKSERLDQVPIRCA
jgi:hypothetical protein